VAPIGVESDEDLIAALDRKPRGGQRRRAKPQFAGPMNAMQPRFQFGVRIAPLACAIRRIIVDDNYFGFRQNVQNLSDKTRQILNLVVRGQSNERASLCHEKWDSFSPRRSQRTRRQKNV
jgi:hypothetical protein